jgi:hypothetical protein
MPSSAPRKRYAIDQSPLLIPSIDATQHLILRMNLDGTKLKSHFKSSSYWTQSPLPLTQQLDHGRDQLA